VRLSDGLKVEVQNPKLRTRLTMHEKPDPKAFDLPAADWKDFSDDPTKGNVGNLVLLAHSAVWQKGQKAGDMNLGLMDVETGRFRRVPFEGASFLPGAFSPDRAKVYGTGDLQGLFEIDLSTGANRALAAGLLLFPAVSPDGRRVAALHMEKILGCRVALVDVQSGETKHIGEAADRAFLSWLPDGLLLLEREWQKDPKEPAIPWICRMDLEGTSKRLRRGNQPALLGTSILYEDGGTWWTCGLDGKNEKAFGDGRRGCVFPCPAPDGQRLLMLRRRANDGPEPIVIDLATGRERVLPRADGLWGQPAWR
jgi:hypothetical protein